jgi:hypothetical protein
MRYRLVRKKVLNNMGVKGFDIHDELLLTGTGMILYQYKMCINN